MTRSRPARRTIALALGPVRAVVTAALAAPREGVDYTVVQPAHPTDAPAAYGVTGVPSLGIGGRYLC